MHVLTGVEVKPIAGNVVTPFTFYVDTVAPAVPSAPALAYYSDSGVQGDNITQYSNPMLTGTAQPNVSIALYNNGLSGMGGAGSGPSGQWSARANLPNGTHAISASAGDSAGNVSARSGDLSLTVDLVAPVTSVTSPGSGSTVSGTVNVGSSASDNVGIWTVDFQVDGVVQATDTTSPYSYAWDSTTVANGQHTLTAIATDLAGRTASSSVTVTVGNGVAATAPGAPNLAAATPVLLTRWG